MLDNLKNEFNKGRTENGAVAFNSTQSDVLDLFSMGGSFRQREDYEVNQLFSKAYNENPLLAMKTLFYLRDIDSGQGERRFFKVVLKHLANNHSNSLGKNLHLIPKFGRWDDLWVLLDTNLKSDVVDLVENQLWKDKFSDTPSLLAKWMPSEGASSKLTRKYARIFISNFETTPKKYRKLITFLRKKIDLVETKLTEKRYEDIQYDKVPSRAGLIYRNAFLRNDNERYTDFLDKLSKGEVTVNAKTLYPYDIVGKALESYDGKNVWSWYANRNEDLSEEEIKLLDAQWNSLPDYVEGNENSNAIAVVDTSGSMQGTPMDVAISLGMYLAEKNVGKFHNHFFTFSDNPQLKEIKGGNIVEKARNISDSDWGASTNVEAVFTKILDVAVQDNVPKDEMIEKVIIISDMQFNMSTRGVDVHIFKSLKEEFEKHGYELPNLVFWNVNAFTSNTQFTMNEDGVELVSGFSPVLFKNVLSSARKTPYELMLEVVDSERYSEINV